MKYTKNVTTGGSFSMEEFSDIHFLLFLMTNDMIPLRVSELTSQENMYGGHRFSNFTYNIEGALLFYVDSFILIY